MSIAKLRLYSSAICVSSRPELLPIRGLVVGVLQLRQSANGEWIYIVALDTKDNTIYECAENELQPTERKSSCADDRPFPLLRNALSASFHQDVDALDKALYYASQCDPKLVLLSEIEELEVAGEAAILQFLDEAMEVNVLDDVSATDFLVALKTLLKLR